MKAQLEALLFAAGEPISAVEIKKITGLPENDIKDIIDDLKSDYRERAGGIAISEVAGGYQMHTNPEHCQWAKKFRDEPPAKFSPAALETLAVIAYKQPITRAELDVLRGVNSDGVVKTLLEKRLIKIVGRKEAPGKPLLYGTTQEFLAHFGLKDLTGLPTLKEFEAAE